uniref:Uncharacterized protein n=1 Tax=Marseillevirus LCMAC103 TaxID=2506604 RepID=A0A481YWN7_9VIRU|nr:MAG: hypothetical protein LCMAC103_03160 [Marseillevirus LCMAC103]
MSIRAARARSARRKVALRAGVQPAVSVRLANGAAESRLRLEGGFPVWRLVGRHCQEKDRRSENQNKQTERPRGAGHLYWRDFFSAAEKKQSHIPAG